MTRASAANTGACPGITVRRRSDKAASDRKGVGCRWIPPFALVVFVATILAVIVMTLQHLRFERDLALTEAAREVGLRATLLAGRVNASLAAAPQVSPGGNPSARPWRSSRGAARRGGAGRPRRAAHRRRSARSGRRLECWKRFARGGGRRVCRYSRVDWTARAIASPRSGRFRRQLDASPSSLRSSFIWRHGGAPRP